MAEGWVHDTVKRIPLPLAPEKFYVDYRLGHWNGPMGQSKPWRINVNPLLLPAAVRKNLELTLGVQTSERFHFEVMRRAAPELVRSPVPQRRLGRRNRGDFRHRPPARAVPAAIKASARTMKTWQWRFLNTQGKQIAYLFEDAARHTEMGAICNMRKLRRLAQHGDRLERVVDAKSLFSAVAVALALLERAEPVLDRP